jgi:hypothetical protein
MSWIQSNETVDSPSESTRGIHQAREGVRQTIGTLSGEGEKLRKAQGLNHEAEL